MNDQKNDIEPDERKLLEEFGTSFEALRAKHADCPKPELLLASQAGVLEGKAAKDVVAHLEKCGFCWILLRDLTDAELTAARPEEERRVRERVLKATRGSAKAETADRLLAAWFSKGLPVAALAVVALAVVVWVRLHRPAAPVSTPATVAVQSAQPAAPSVFQWEKLPIKLQASSILVWRGKPRTAQEEYATELTAALAYYRDDNYAEAAQQLAKVVQAFPDGVEAQLYLGISQLSLQRNEQAIPSLAKARQLGPEAFREDAAWYLALAYKRTGDPLHAAAELQKLCSRKGVYQQRACAGIEELPARPGE
jgi:TolA-binding protein